MCVGVVAVETIMSVCVCVWSVWSVGGWVGVVAVVCLGVEVNVCVCDHICVCVYECVILYV